MDCGHGWRYDADCDICRPPAVEVARLRGRITDLEAALRPLVDALLSEMGDGTESEPHEPDDSNVYAGAPDGTGITFGLIRRARDVLAK